MKDYINIVAGRSAVLANKEAEFGNEQEEEAITLIAMLYGDQADTADSHGERYRLLKSMVSGYLHAAGEDRDPEHRGTVSLAVMQNHMGSNYRKSTDPYFEHMLKAAFEVVPFTRKTSAGKSIHYERYRLREDLSDVFVRFKDEVHKAGLRIRNMGLFE